MNRRDTLKTLGITAVAAGGLLNACQPKEQSPSLPEAAAAEPGREAFEVEREKKLLKETFFTANELAVVTILADMIIPKDDHSGSASDAEVPAFIEFIVKDIPSHQLPMRGGIRWLDLQCMNRFGATFKNCGQKRQVEIVDMIAYPAKAEPAMLPGVAFFNLVRDLTASGFYTTKMGVKDLGYVGNAPGKWEGVPADVLKQYGMEDIV